MEKELKIGYEEYQQMLKLLDSQQDCINQLVVEKCLIVDDFEIKVDRWTRMKVPRIIGNPQLSLEYLDEKHKQLMGSKSMFNLAVVDVYKEQCDLYKKQAESIKTIVSKTHWFKRMLNIIDYEN